MSRAFYFGAGPAMLPEPILRQAQKDIYEWDSSGISILEMGHRTTDFQNILDQAEDGLRRLLNIPSDYHVLFLTNPARMLFSLLPLNFLNGKQKAQYLVTGIWSKMAYLEAEKVAQAHLVASGESENFHTIPASKNWQLDENARYFFYTPNETVNGIYCDKPSVPASMPLIADMTSCLLAEPIVVSDYDCIFAGAQKNIANAGLTIVILSSRLQARITNDSLPTMFDLRTHVAHHSLYATPATFNCYLAGQMIQWLESYGGIETVYANNQAKAKVLYDFLDQSSLFYTKVDTRYRSLFNVCFYLQDPKLYPSQIAVETLEKEFLDFAKTFNCLGLQGHRLVGGLRASLYNAMPMEGVVRLIDCMQAFEDAWRSKK